MSATFIWDVSLEVGVQTIDNQHRMLLEKIYRLFDDITLGYHQSILEGISFLQGYVIEHFAVEEKIMLKYLYPDFIAHREAHTRYVHSVYHLKSRIQNEGPTSELAEMLKGELYEWFVVHIQEQDVALGEFIRSVRYAAE